MTGDGRTQPGNTNLEVKGIIAIKAMSDISKVVGIAKDAEKYLAAATTMVAEWQSRAVSNNHLLLLYGNNDSDGLIYNLYADKLLKTDLIPEHIYSGQAAHYNAQLQTETSQSIFGLPYDNTHPGVVKPRLCPVSFVKVLTLCYPDWTMFTAAALQNYSVVNVLIDLVHRKASSNSSSGVFPASYQSNDGTALEGEASPALGAMFALLALDLETKDITAPLPDVGSSRRSSSKTNIIVGIILGTLVGLGIIGLAIRLVCRWKKKLEQDDTQATPFVSHLKMPRIITRSSIAKPGADVEEQAVEIPSTHPNPPIPPTLLPPSFRTQANRSPVDVATVSHMRREVADLRRVVCEMRESIYGQPPPSYPD